MAKKEITIEQLLDSEDWSQVFADENYGNVSKDTDPVPPGSDVPSNPASRSDVAEIIAAVNGENDGQEWLGLFLLKDGRYLVASGSCDYTGWGCRAGNSMSVAATLSDALQFGLSEEQRGRLGL